MIDTILQSVQKAEGEAAKRVEDAQHKSSQIRKEAHQEADLQQKKLKEQLEEDRQSRWNTQKEEESKKDEKGEKEIRNQLDHLREEAYQKLDQVQEALISEIRES